MTDTVSRIQFDVSTIRFKCDLCQIVVVGKHFVEHKLNPKLFNGISKETCKFCNQNLIANSFEAIIEHLKVSHSGHSLCPACKKEFLNMDDLYYHVAQRLLNIYHCKNETCSFMTTIESKFHEHLNVVHHEERLCNVEYIIRCKYEHVGSKPPESVKNEAFSLDDKRKLAGDGKLIKNSRKLIDVDSDGITLRLVFTTDGKVGKPADTKILKLDYSERVFCKAFKGYDPDLFMDLKRKMNEYKKHYVKIEKINDVKTFYCCKCSYSTDHNHSTVRRHILGLHLGIPSDLIRQVMATCRYSTDLQLLPDCELIEILNKSRSTDEGLITDSENEYTEEAYDESIYNGSEDSESGLSQTVIISPPKKKVKTEASTAELNINIENSVEINNSSSSTRILQLDYSERIFNKYFRNADKRSVADLKQKMECYRKCTVTIHKRSNSKKFSCSMCSYTSDHNHSTVRRHILGFHLGISPGIIRKIMATSRFNADLHLLSDAEMIRCINKGRMNRVDMVLSDSENEEVSHENDRCSVTPVSEETSAPTSHSNEYRLIETVQFSYSPTILSSICKMENINIVDIISAKMELFTQCKASVYKIGPNRVFQCIVCGWSSSLTMTDIVRHVLTVHVGFEGELRQFRKIALICSRMDRNFNLLSDEDLSDIGWKGRKIVLSNSSNKFRLMPPVQ